MKKMLGAGRRTTGRNLDPYCFTIDPVSPEISSPQPFAFPQKPVAQFFKELGQRYFNSFPSCDRLDTGQALLVGFNGINRHHVFLLCTQSLVQALNEQAPESSL